MTAETEVTTSTEGDRLMSPVAPRVFARPLADGTFDREIIGDQITAPDGLHAVIYIVEQPDGWRASMEATLPDAELDEPVCPIADAPYTTRAAAVIFACERLVDLCGAEKEKGKKKHQAAAAKVQEWALALARRVALEAAAAGDVDARPGTADDAIPGAVVDVIRDVLDAADLSARTIFPFGVQMIPVDQIYEHPDNPRTIYAEGPLAELAASMADGGFLLYKRLIAVPRPEGGVYAVAGNRRRRAAKMAGLTEIPCDVQDLSRNEIFDILNFDNLPGVQVHVLHEAAGWQQLLDHEAWTIEDIMARVGRGQSYVYKRLLVARMIDAAKSAFLNDQITFSHAEIIARCALRDQMRVLQVCLPSPFDLKPEVMSTRDLKLWIDKNLHIDLTGAPFSLSSMDVLPSAGSCAACPHRVGNLPDFDAANDLPDMCTQPPCYDAKLAAHIEQEKKRLQEEYGYLILVSHRADAREDGVLPHSEWHREPLGSTHPNAKYALMIDGAKVGTVLRIVIQERLPLAPPPAPDLPPAPPVASAPDPKADKASKDELERQRKLQARNAEIQREREEDARRAIERETFVRQQLAAAILAKVAWPPPREAIALMLQDWLGQLHGELEDLIIAQGVDPINGPQNMVSVKDDHLARLATLLVLNEDFEEFALGHAAPNLDAAAKRYGLDIKALRKRASLEYTATACEIDFEADIVEFKPGKTVFAEVRIEVERDGGAHLGYGVHLPVKGGEGYGRHFPLSKSTWKDRGEAWDQAFVFFTEFLGTVKGYAPATDATRSAAAQVEKWVKSGQAARAAIRELAAPAPVEQAAKTRKDSIKDLPTLADKAKKAPAKPAAPPSAKAKPAPAKQARAPKSGGKKARGKK